RRPDVRVPARSPIDPLPTGPSDPGATPVQRRSPDGGRLPVFFRGLPAAVPRSSLLGPAKRSSIRAGRHTPASLGSASPTSADHWWRHGHTARPATFSLLYVTGQKRVPIFLFGKPVFWAFQNVTQPWPQSILFGQAKPSYYAAAGVVSRARVSR